jgi:hypothetical protein
MTRTTLIKEIWAFRDNRTAVRFAYEWHDDSGNWFRSYGTENWEFDKNGLMRLRIASINDLCSIRNPMAALIACVAAFWATYGSRFAAASTISSGLGCHVPPGPTGKGAPSLQRSIHRPPGETFLAGNPTSRGHRPRSSDWLPPDGFV